MKAVVFWGNGDIRYMDYAEPRLAPGTVKVRVFAAGICGSDLPRALGTGAHQYPIVLGHEFSGRVVEVGEGVEGLAVGDTVACAPLLPCMACPDCQMGNYSLCRHYSFIGSREQGGFADMVVIPAKNAIKYDPSIPYEMAAMFEPATVSLHGLLVNDYRAGGTVAILGCGTIGIFALQWAKIFGGKTILAYDIDEQRLGLAQRLGADVCINTRTQDYLAETMRVTQNRGCDFVFEAAGNPVTMKMGYEIAANKANYCCIGTPRRDMTFTVKQWEAMNRKEFHLTGSWMSYSAPFPGREWTLTAHYFATGHLKFDPAFTYRQYPMSRADEAFACFQHPEQVHGKILLRNS